jgi:hypothetical protein
LLLLGSLLGIQLRIDSPVLIQIQVRYAMVLIGISAGAVALKSSKFRRILLISSVIPFVERLRIIIVMTIRYAL